MKSLKEVFNKTRDETPFWSDYTCFAEAVRGENSLESLLPATLTP
jgi:hypothetical protein